MAKIINRINLYSVVITILSGCSVSYEKDEDSGPMPGSIDVSSIPNAIPRVEPKSRYGNPKSYVVRGDRYYVMNDSEGFVQRGVASWYGKKFHGRRTSSGEIYDMYAMTAAHKTLPLPTYLEVLNLKNGKKIIVKANDRGPFHENRIVDLSYTAAEKLGIVQEGTGLVEIRAINPRTYEQRRAPVTTVVNYGAREIYIQAGSFKHLLNAENLHKALAEVDGRLVNISEVIINGQPVYRVRIGPITDIDTADRIVSSLSKHGIEDHRFVFD